MDSAVDDETFVLLFLSVFDAVGKPPTGTLTGNLHFIGSYDQCLAIKAEKASSNQHLSTTNTRYCRATFGLSEGLIASVREYIGDVVSLSTFFLFPNAFNCMLCIWLIDMQYLTEFPPGHPWRSPIPDLGAVSSSVLSEARRFRLVHTW